MQAAPEEGRQQGGRAGASLALEDLTITLRILILKATVIVPPRLLFPPLVSRMERGAESVFGARVVRRSCRRRCARRRRRRKSTWRATPWSTASASMARSAHINLLTRSSIACVPGLWAVRGSKPSELPLTPRADGCARARSQAIKREDVYNPNAQGTVYSVEEGLRFLQSQRSERAAEPKPPACSAQTALLSVCVYRCTAWGIGFGSCVC